MELLIVIGVIVVLISLLMPVLRKTRETANRAVCTSNLRQVIAAAMAYQAANGALPDYYRTAYNDCGYPAFIYWRQWAPYLDKREAFSCPGGRPASEVYVPNPDGNWTGEKILGSYFYVGGLRNARPEFGGLNDFGPTPQKAAANEAQICKDLQGRSASGLLVTEGIELVGSPDWIYFSHNEIGFADRAESYAGFHIYVDKRRIADFAGFNQGYADGHVVWVNADNRMRDVQALWNEDYKFRHWIWAKFYW